MQLAFTTFLGDLFISQHCVDSQCKHLPQIDHGVAATLRFYRHSSIDWRSLVDFECFGHFRLLTGPCLAR
jgi:hypothetical protein